MLPLVMTIVKHPFYCCNNRFVWKWDHCVLASLVVGMHELYLQGEGVEERGIQGV